MYALKTLALFLTLLCSALTASALDPPLRATPDKVRSKLKELDEVLKKRSGYLAAREHAFSAILSDIGPSPADTVAAYIAFSDEVATYSARTAIKYLNEGLRIAEENELPQLAMECRLALAAVYPDYGLTTEALLAFQSVNFADLPTELQYKYYTSGETMYEIILDYYANSATDTKPYEAKCTEFRKNAMYYFHPESPEWILREAKQYYDSDNYLAAQIALYDLIQELDDTSPLYSEAARLMSECVAKSGLNHDVVYYLAAAAVSETKRGDREGVALHLTGQSLFDYGDIDRAHSYLSKAIETIPEAGALSYRSEALINTLMTMDKSYDAKMKSNITLLSGLIVVLVLWGVFISLSLRNHKKIVRQLSLERHLVVEANNAKSTFLRLFLELGIASTRRLMAFNKLVTRKVATKQVDELYETSRSGKIIDEQCKQFLAMFDTAFLSIYPSFVTEVNTLLRPEEKYALKDGHLPSELRVMALTKLGVEDVSRIADVMGFSVSTVYAYRTKIRNKAINKDTFDIDIMNIGSISPLINAR